MAESLERETAQLEGLVATLRDAVERLEELRTALISAAVTSKIDVRQESSVEPAQGDAVGPRLTPQAS